MNIAECRTDPGAVRSGLQAQTPPLPLPQPRFGSPQSPSQPCSHSLRAAPASSLPHQTPPPTAPANPGLPPSNPKPPPPSTPSAAPATPSPAPPAFLATPGTTKFSADTNSTSIPAAPILSFPCNPGLSRGTRARPRKHSHPPNSSPANHRSVFSWKDLNQTTAPSPDFQACPSFNALTLIPPPSGSATCFADVSVKWMRQEFRNLSFARSPPIPPD